MTGEGAPGEDLRAIAIEQIDGAREVLRDAGKPSAIRVHEARKHLKKTRALLRLLAEPLGARESETRRRLRKAGRELSASRDATVIRIAFDEIVAAGVAGADAEVLGHIGARLRSAVERAEAASGGLDAAMAEVSSTLAEVREEVAAWNLDTFGQAELVAACAKTYHKARRELRRLERQSDPVAAHEWRKRLKEHWYHMRLLGESRAAGLDAVGEQLGKANDLAVLQEHLEQGSERDAALERAVESLRRRGLGEACERGDVLFDSKRAEFAAFLLRSR